MKTLIDYSNVINSAANNKEVSLLTNYIYKLATTIHSFYTECRVLDPNNVELTRQRLALCSAAKIVMKNALNLVGVEAPIEM
jgi:arginyl-tRNA synthetase